MAFSSELRFPLVRLENSYLDAEVSLRCEVSPGLGSSKLFGFPRRGFEDCFRAGCSSFLTS
jgi:hypothetical protein